MSGPEHWRMEKGVREAWLYELVHTCSVVGPGLVRALLRMEE